MVLEVKEVCLTFMVLFVAVNTVTSATNIARGRSTYQSSTQTERYLSRGWRTWSFSSSYAADGSTGTSSRQCAQTKSTGTDPWWAVRLSKVYYVHSVKITNIRGSSGYKLHDFLIGVTDKLPSSYAPFSYGYQLCYRHVGAVTPGATVTFNCTQEVKGKYVIIQLPGKHRALRLCEVQVFASSQSVIGNAALGKKTYESSHNGGVDRSGKAVDGSKATDGSKGQCSHTKLEADPWWSVDLGSRQAVQKVTITNRGDCCSYRLSYFVVGVTDLDPRKVAPRPGRYTVCNAHIGSISRGSSKTISCDTVVQGRYLTIQIPGQYRILSLCEVDVYVY